MNITVEPLVLNKNGYTVNLLEGVHYEEDDNHLRVQTDCGILNIFFKSDRVEIFARHNNLKENSFLFENIEDAIFSINHCTFEAIFPEKVELFANERKVLLTQNLSLHLLPLDPSDPNFHKGRKYYTVDVQKKQYTRESRKPAKEDMDNIFENMQADVSMETVFNVL
jgi:hypothetical protein